MGRILFVLFIACIPILLLIYAKELRRNGVTARSAIRVLAVVLVAMSVIGLVFSMHWGG